MLPTFRGITLRAIPAMPLVSAGDELCEIVLQTLSRAQMTLVNGDVLVIAQKVVSKAEGRLVDLATVIPSRRAIDIATETRKDPRLVELVLQESTEVLRCRPDVLIVRHRLGFVVANAGIDQSNVRQAEAGSALLLPLDPDASARRMAIQILARTGVAVGVIIIDSFGRAWRLGTVGTAIGVSGLPALLDLRGQPDLFGRLLQTTELGYADEIAAAASLLMGQAAEACPAVVVSGLAASSGDGRARDLVRPPARDLFP